MNSLKLILCFLVSMAFSACGPSEPVRGGPVVNASTPEKRPVEDSGRCSDSVIIDAQEIKDISEKSLHALPDDTRDFFDDAKREEAKRRIAAARDLLMGKIETFRANYGDFTCVFRMNGENQIFN